MFKQTRQFLRELWALTRPYWFSEERWSGRGLLAIILAMNLGLVYVVVRFNEWNRVFYNALEARAYAAFWHQIGIFSILAAFYIVIAVYQSYLQQMLQIRWRQWLTKQYLKDWLADRTYYHLQLLDGGADNPDQRISQDLQFFVAQTLSLGLGLISAVVTLVSFIDILWTISGPLAIPIDGVTITVPGYMLWAALVYAIAGTVLTHVIGRRLVRLSFDQQRYEADFRFALVRLRENTEGIALYQGEAGEEKILDGLFGYVVQNWWGIMRRQKSLAWFTSFYGQLAVTFPFLVAAPRYFSGAIQLGSLMQIASAFGQVQGALSWFVNAYTSLADWKATVERLTGFQAALAEARAAAAAGGLQRHLDPAADVAVEHAALALPRGGLLLDDVDLRLVPGQSALISGPSGAGKSTLFRALAGIWPFGRGTIRMPGGSSMLFLPQRPYLPLGTLRSVLSYPGMPKPDGELQGALEAVGLTHLAARLDERENWALQLSPGEQQRLSAARALLLRPGWLFLDEATSAVDEGTEERLYRTLRERLPDTTIVSIGHRSSLERFHERHLAVRREGAIAKIEEVGSFAIKALHG